VELSSQSKILPHGKVKLVDEYLLEGIQTVLLVEDKHCLLLHSLIGAKIRRIFELSAHSELKITFRGFILSRYYDFAVFPLCRFPVSSCGCEWMEIF
jgi:hypothetical protein